MKLFLYFIMGCLSLIGAGSVLFIGWTHYNANQKYYALVENICYQYGRHGDECVFSEPDKGLYRSIIYVPNRSTVLSLAMEAWRAENLKPNSSMKRLKFYLDIRQKELEADAEYGRQPTHKPKRNEFNFA